MKLEAVKISKIKGAVYQPRQQIEGQQLDHNILLNWLKQYEMTYHHIHISGHTFGAQLKEIIKEIPAKKILPIHTLHPELFQDLSDKKTLIPKFGESISL